jgi:hypothetical protein
VVSGKPGLSADVVTVDGKKDTRLISATSHNGTDMVVTSTVTLKDGRGYGVLVRASAVKGNDDDKNGNDQENANGSKLSGYLVEYDPGYSAVVPGYGPALVLRLTDRGSTCSTPLALTRMPDAIAAAGAHRLVIVVRGDALTATVDDTTVLDVSSLSSAIAAVPCKMATPAGDEVGLQNWAQAGSSVVFSHTTLN